MSVRVKGLKMESESISIVRRAFAEKKQGFDVEAISLLADLHTDLSIRTLCQIRIFNRYDISGITRDEYEKAKITVLSEPPVDRVYDETAPVEDACFVLGIESLPGQYDQRADSAAQCIQILTQKDRPLVKAARVLAFYGTLSSAEKDGLTRYLINPVETRAASLDKPESLVNHLDPPGDIVVLNGFLSHTEAELVKLGEDMGLAMSHSDLLFVRDFFEKEKREPTITEIRVLDTYWSDHCRHTTFNTELTDITFLEPDDPFSCLMQDTLDHYQRTRTEVYGDKISQKPLCLMDLATMAMRCLKRNGKLADLDESEEINACSIKTTIETDGQKDDYIIMFKNETHNHPTEIEPFGGAATCLGGAIRDPLSGRSYVYQAMRVTGAGDPRQTLSETLPGKLSQKKLVRTAAAGYSSYGNQIGLATGLVDELYHPGYTAKRMEIGAVIGAAPASAIIRKRPSDGDIVLLVGGKTGRDGIGGATGSSKAHDEKSVTTCGSEVQKGNPPTERKIQRLFRNPDVTKLIIRCNDFGAGGVSVAVGELADGISIDLDAVPKKYEGLDGTELAISESQERMAVVIHPKNTKKFMAFVKEENLEAVQIAAVTKTPRMIMTWRGEKIVDLPRAFIDTNGAPAFAKAAISLPETGKNYHDSLPDTYMPGDFVKSLQNGLSSLESCSRKGLSQRFDSTIGAATVLMPFAGEYQLSPEEGMVAKIPVKGGKTDTVTFMSYGFDPYYSEWSPFYGSYYAVVESLLRLAAMGADTTKARLTFQEYFERLSSDTAWGKPLSALLGAYRAQLDYEVPAIGGKDSMSGSYNDLHVPPTLVSFAVGVGKAKDAISSACISSGKTMYCIPMRKDKNNLPDLKYTKRTLDVLRQIAKRGQMESCAVVRSGGIAVRVAQMLMGNHFGFSFLDDLKEEDLFKRSLGSVLLVVKEKNAVDKIEMTGGFPIGKITGDPVLRYQDVQIATEDAVKAFEDTLEPIFPTKTTEDSSLLPLPAERKNISVAAYIRKIPAIAKPRVFIPVFPGTNCEYDTENAFIQAGAKTDTLVIKNQTPADIIESLAAIKDALNRANILMLPGGFSGGDEPEGSAKFIVAAFRNPMIADALENLLRQRDGLILGICNGFQALVKLGLLPFGKIQPLEPDGPTLTFNRIGRLQSGYVTTKMVSPLSPWLSGTHPDDLHWIPVSHGEGRFVADSTLVSELFEKGQVCTQYVDPKGNPSMDTRYNPNGSICAIEGITSRDGRILGKMGHSERIGEHVGKNIPGCKDQKIFESGVGYFS